MVSTAVQGLPGELAQFKERQQRYSASQHEAWRYIRMVGHPFFLRHAHQSYEPSLRMLDISMDSIPRISVMDAKLNEFGCGAMGVNGFIPPAVFMGLQERGVTPISTDMRQPSNIGYTPSPDIMHEG